MREIKFRAWSLDTKQWIHSKMVNASILYYQRDKESALMEHTGLKDKNGVEIFEGDILNLNGDIHTVGFKDGCFVLLEETIFNKKIEPLYDHFFKEYEGTDLEVVGNIHENSELLEAQK